MPPVGKIGRPVLVHHDAVVGERDGASDGLLIVRVRARNSSIEAATPITPRAIEGVPRMYADKPTAWCPSSLPAEATNTVPRSTTRCAALASSEFSVP